jgi:hypothetical protein
VRVAATAAVLLLALVLAQPVRGRLAADAPRAPLLPVAEAQGLAGSVLAGSFRPMLLTYLWLRTDALYAEGRDEECFEIYRLLHRLYPGNERARDFVGWFLAFNLKQKAPDIALGWKWARTGLEMLLSSPDGPPIIADWIRKQCGQNSLVLERYAGPPWEEERAWRARLRAFGVTHFHEDLSRFALGVRVLEGRGKFGDRLRRAFLLRSLAYEELLRYGGSAHLKDAIAALRGMAEEFADDDLLRADFEGDASGLAAAAAGRVPEPLRAPDAYPVAMALWGLGVKARDPEMLTKAEGILAAVGKDLLREEILEIRRWREHILSAQEGPPPPFPFDGMR